MTDIEKKRQALLAVYPGEKWALKVRLMNDNQVIAIYLNLKRQNKLKEKE